MQGRQLGKHGPTVSSLGLGAMGMSGMYGPADRQESIATVHAALDAGIALIDTGDFYGRGHNELLLGEALRGVPRDRFLISVKVGALRDPAGGWSGYDARPAAVKNFLAYTLQRFSYPARLGDRVALWLTHNEPWCQAFLGYEIGLFAPGERDMTKALLAAHHLLVSHGLSVQALRSHVRAPVGIAPNFMPAFPASDSDADRAAARRQDGYFNRWFIEPVLGRGYPADMLELFGAAMPNFDASDLDVIAQPIG